MRRHEHARNEKAAHLMRARVSLTILLTNAFLVLVGFSPDAWGQTFFLQGADGANGADGAVGTPGPAGDPELACADGECTFEGDLIVDSDVEVTGSGAFEVLEVSLLTVTESVWLPDCPSGYELDPDPDGDGITLCTRDLGGGVLDEMVRVGDIWVDRFEATVWENPDCTGAQYGDTDDWGSVGDTFPYHGQFSEPLHACSVQGEIPSRFLTWFQAQAACAASGKRLITNAEWQAAVAGTVDPGPSSGAGGACVTSGDLRSTGGGSSCVSYWGAEDMIGNLYEWVDDWYGQGGDDDVGFQPAQYSSDGYWNVDSAMAQAPYGTHFPAAGLRGGMWADGTRAGAFTMTLSTAPSTSYPFAGFRCARGF